MTKKELRLKKKREKKQRYLDLKERKGFVLSVYLFLRGFVVLTMIRQFMNGNYSGVFLCILTLILFLIPSLLDKHFRIELPGTLEIIILLFIFSAEILGEINEFYLHFKNWDMILHTINGFIMAAIGFSLINILNNDERFHVHLSPLFVSIFALCFSMTIGIFWEFFEYGVDNILKFDMQKDTIVQSITSVKLDPEGKNNSITMPIETLVVNGEDWMLKYGGYIDLGLHDTMGDLLVNFIGAIIFSIFGWLYIKNNNRFAEQFMPKRRYIEKKST